MMTVRHTPNRRPAFSGIMHEIDIRNPLYGRLNAMLSQKDPEYFHFLKENPGAKDHGQPRLCVSNINRLMGNNLLHGSKCMVLNYLIVKKKYCI
jgi:hypothetical protein